MKLLDQFFKPQAAKPRPTLRPDPVFVIGMHRSGTSALGGVLESLGLTIGKTVMPPNPAEGNPKGFAENLALMQLHDRFLESVKSIWWDCEPVRGSRFTGSGAKHFQEELLQLLAAEFGPGRPLIKDPRMCRLMPLWLPLIREYFPSAQFILPIRNPVEVATSLVKRDKLPVGQCLKLWVVHVIESERHTRGLNRQFTTYDQLMSSPVETVAGLMKKLALPMENVAAAVAAQIDSKLRRHTDLPWPSGEPGEELTLAIHQALISQGPGLEEKLDQLRTEYYRLMRWKT